MKARFAALVSLLLAVAFIACGPRRPAFSPTSTSDAGTELVAGDAGRDAGRAPLIGSYQDWGSQIADAGTYVPPGGTGFVHITSGTQDGTARAVNVSTADITGVGGVTHGFTGLSSLGSALQLLRVNAAGTANEYWTLSVDLSTQSTGTLPLNRQAAPGGTGLAHVAAGNWLDPATLLVNADVSAVAAIDVSKLAGGTNGYYLQTTTGVPTWGALSADLATQTTGTLPLGREGAPTGTGLAKVTSGSWSASASLLVDADVASGAAIALSKLAPCTNGYLITTVSGVQTCTATLAASAGGTGQAGFGAIDTVLATTHAGGASTWTLIGNNNVAAAAAIAGTKISPDFGSQNVTTSGNGSLTGASSSFVMAGASAHADIGTTPATSGQFRAPNSTNLFSARNAANTADITIFGKASDDVYLGGSASATNQATNIYLLAKTAGTVGIGINATVIESITTNDVQVVNGKNLSLGSTSPSYGSGTNEIYFAAGTEPSGTPSAGGVLYTKVDGSSDALRWKDHNGFTFQMGGGRVVISTAHSLTTTEAAHRYWKCSALAGGTVTAPAGGGTEDDVYDVIVSAVASDCVIAGSQGGTTVTVTGGTSKHVLIDKAGVHNVMSATAVAGTVVNAPAYP